MKDRCGFPSSVSNATCIAPPGHAAASPFRFHTFGPREMVEVGTEGDHFHRHFEGKECAKAGCVEITPAIEREIAAEEARFARRTSRWP